jgi:type VII secretion system (Wss) protein YukD
MGMIELEVWDATGSKRQKVEVPDDVAVNRILVVLVERLSLPRQSPDGQIMSYKFHHKTTGTQLLDRQTLSEAGVKPGDVLRIQPEITAGGAAVPRPGPA